MDKLSVIIPARNEIYLEKTIRDVLKNAHGDIEVIAILDGYIPDPQIVIDDDRVIFLHYPESLGQRQSINEAAKVAKGEYIMKLDAHCAVGPGFDVILIRDCKPEWTMVPRMYNLNHETWLPKKHKLTDYMYISSPDAEKPFRAQYYEGKAKDDGQRQPKNDKMIDETMCCMGPCFFMHKKRFFELGGCDTEFHGHWGQQGIEVSCKAWLSGGALMVNKNTWFAHWFRGGGGPGFPWPASGRQQENTRKGSRDMWLNNKWPLAKHEFQWLVDKFNPPGWNHEYEVSVIIPARNEKFLKKTVEGLCENLKTNFEILVGLDDCDTDLEESERVKIWRSDKRIGMRPMINKLASMAKGKYLLRADAHILIDKGMDKFMIASHKPGFTVVARRYLLDTPTWTMRKKTDCDYRRLTPLNDPRGGLRSLAWEEYELEHHNNMIDELMTCSGSNWLMERSQWNKWGGLDEKHGTFGQEGAEIACMTWLSGGTMIINKRTWYAHWNRGKAPYALGHHQKRRSIERSIEKWTQNKWKHQTRDFQWLIDKFQPPGWKTTKSKNLKGVYGFRVKDMEVDELYDNFIKYSDPFKAMDGNKRGSEALKKTFCEFLDKVALEQEISSDDEYCKYLFHHIDPKLRNTDKGRDHVKRKILDGIKLYENMRDTGMHTPLDLVKYPGGTYIIRGNRRLFILKKLGIKYVPVRVHESKALFYKNKSFIDRRDGGRVEKVAIYHFQKWGLKSSDKYWHHNYTYLYDRHLKLSNKPRILEIGVKRGASLRLWSDAYPKAEIHGIDIKDVSKEKFTRSGKYKLYKGSQTDCKFLESVASGKKFDLIVDDASHMPEHQVITLKALWPRVAHGGIYVIEDMCSGRGRKDRDKLMNEIKQMIDSVVSYGNVSSVATYNNICFIEKE